MPNRILREGILSSERVDALASWASETFYRRLHSVVDDFGRYYANPSLLRAACYPLKLDKVSNADVDKWLADCAGAGLVSTYEVDGKRYLQLLDFRQQVRATASKYPEPPSGCLADAQQLRTKTETYPETDAKPKSDSETKAGAKDKAARGARTRSPRAPMPEGFEASPRVEAWAQEKGFDRLDEHLESFRRKCAANGYTYADWDAAFMEAIREDWAKLRGGRQAGRQGIEDRNLATVDAWVRGEADARN